MPSISYVPLENPDCYEPSNDNCIQKPISVSTSLKLKEVLS